MVALSVIGIAAIQTNTLKAQIVVSQADMPVAGNKFVVVNDSNDASLSPSPMGPSVTWNYSGIGTTTVDTIKCVLPGSTIYGAFFPAANIALTYSLPGGLQDAFANSSAGAFSVNGVVEDFNSNTVILQFKPVAEKLFAFPMNYLSAWRSLYTYKFQVPITNPTYDSMRIKSFVFDTSTVDSWGNCTTPFGTYGVLRVMEVQRTLDSLSFQNTTTKIWKDSGRFVQADTMYQYLANGLGFPLLTMHMRGGKVMVASWLKGNGTGINEVTDNAGSLVYPNPAQTELNIKLASCEDGYVNIIDITGRQISSTKFSDKLANINTSHFANGMYFYQVFDKSSNLIDRGKFSVVK